MIWVICSCFNHVIRNCVRGHTHPFSLRLTCSKPRQGMSGLSTSRRRAVADDTETFESAFRTLIVGRRFARAPNLRTRLR